MGSNDRSDLIKALGNAYKKNEPKADSRVVTESTRFDGQNYARVIVNESDQSETKAYIDYPEAFVIRDFATLLKGTKDGAAERAARDLETKFIKAAAAKNDALVNKMIELSRSTGTRLRTISASSPQRAIFIMLAVEEIKKL